MSFGIAFYGKGGIGKSTVSSNLSYMLASMGNRVAHIGCDPKHDSTRSLMGGKVLPTVLDMIRSTKVSDRVLDDAVGTGVLGIRCAEAGGPSPGVGCAGKGILSMFQTLERVGFYDEDYDFMVYDVLGDVVCGGFAVPMRPERSDAVVIVTSGEFMSLYAANNIMRGLLNFESDKPRLAGLVFNSRGSPGEETMVAAFSRATGVPVIATVPRSEMFARAEQQSATLCQMSPSCEESGVFAELADRLVSISEGGAPMYRPEPLTDVQLEELASEGMVRGTGGFRSAGSVTEHVGTAHMGGRVRRIGMGPIGAVVTAGKVTDVPVIIHGSRACGYSMLNEITTERLAYLESNPGGRVGDGGNILCSHTGPAESVFGGSGGLEDMMEQLAHSNRLIIAITTCLTSMIGDDVQGAAERVMRRHPGTKVVVIDGNGAVEGIDAHMEVLRALCGIIDTDRKPDPDVVRIIDDNSVRLRRGRDEAVIRDIISGFGKKLATTFVSDCTLDEVEGLRTTYHAIMYEDTRSNRELADLLRDKGIRICMNPLPRGYSGTCRWVEHLGKMFGDSASADRILAAMEDEYRYVTDSARDVLAGRRITILDTGDEDTGWIKESLSDCGVSDIDVFRTEGSSDAEGAVVCGSVLEMVERVQASDPDLVIGPGGLRGSFRGSRYEAFPDTTVAHTACVMFIRRTCDILSSFPTEGWLSWGDAE